MAYEIHVNTGWAAKYESLTQSVREQLTHDILASLRLRPLPAAGTRAVVVGSFTAICDVNPATESICIVAIY